MRLRFDGKDRLAVDGSVKPVHELVAMREEEFRQFGLVRATRTLGDLLLHHGEPEMVGQRDGILRKGDDPDRKLNGFAGKAARQPLAIPTLIDLPEIFTDLFRQADSLSDPLRDLTVA